jgi:murein DD-endopeptidase MepM/ murein hydrolase activator NlpD
MRLMLFSIGLVFLGVAQTVLAQENPPIVASLKLADGFDFPLGPPDATGYYKSRGFNVHGHLGEDWVSENGPGAVFRDPVHSIGQGVVTLARDFLRAWGNVVVIRHGYLEDGQVKFIDSLYGHLDKILVAEGQTVSRGQVIGLVGNAHGIYAPHLHFEIHKNLTIGVVHTAANRDMTSYQDPTTFLSGHRSVRVSRDVVTTVLNTYTMPSFPGIPTHPRIITGTVERLANSEAERRRNLVSQFRN